MKKVSVSLAAVLAIVFAVASAFTTTSKSKLPTSYKAYYITVDALSSSSTPTNATADANKVGDILHQASSAFEVDPYGSCTNDVNHICVAEIAYESNGTPSSGNVADFKTGDNPL